MASRFKRTGAGGAYRRYLQAVGKQLAPLQVNHGGPILMVQVENEYGSYGADKHYLAFNKKMFEEVGFDGLLYTCDPVRDVAAEWLKKGANEVTVLELLKPQQTTLSFLNHAILSEIKPTAATIQP